MRFVLWKKNGWAFGALPPPAPWELPRRCVCTGTIPLAAFSRSGIRDDWLADGMNMGSAAAFMITGPATKITNLGAAKIVLDAKRFVMYLTFTILFALMTGWVVDLAV